MNGDKNTKHIFLILRVCVYSIDLWGVAYDRAILKIQSTIVISKSKGLSEIFRDIRTSTYQIYRIEDKK